MANKISWLKSTPEWKAAKKSLDLEDYEFIPPNMKYLKQMIRLNISSFTTGPILLMTNVRLLMVTAHHSSRMKHLCENGIGILAIEKKSRKAVAYAMYMDMCDDFYVEAERSLPVPSVELGYVSELFGALYKTVESEMPSFNDGMWNSEQELRQLWGVFTTYVIACVSPHLQGRGLVALMTNFLHIILFELGYQCMHGITAHYKTVGMAQAIKEGEFIGSVDVLNFEFSDGNSVRKLLRKHRKAYNFDDEFMQQMENSLVLKMCRINKYKDCK